MKATTTALVVVAALAFAGCAAAIDTNYTSIVDALMNQTEVSTIAGSLGLVPGINKTLSNPNWTGTVFAPVNAAVASLNETATAAGASVGSDNETLANILNYHVLPKEVLTGQAAAAGCYNLSTAFKDDPAGPAEKVQLYNINGSAYVVGSQAEPAKILKLLRVGNKSALVLIDQVLLPNGTADLLYSVNEAPNTTVDVSTNACKKPLATTLMGNASSSPVPPMTTEPPAESPAAEPPAPSPSPAKSGAASVGVSLGLLALPVVWALL